MIDNGGATAAKTFPHRSRLSRRLSRGRLFASLP